MNARETLVPIMLMQHACTVNPCSVVPRLPPPPPPPPELRRVIAAHGEPGDEATIHPGLQSNLQGISFHLTCPIGSLTNCEGD